jgi:hypothetical protein
MRGRDVLTTIEAYMRVALVIGEDDIQIRA